MMSWSSTSRRNGVAGVVRLFSRHQWRNSEYGPALERVVRSALDDGDRVNRLHAAKVVRLLEPDPQAGLALLRERLVTEPDGYVAALLTSELAALARNAPADADAVIEEVIALPAWQARFAATDQDELGTVEPLISLTLWLAIMYETPAATAFAGGWFTDPVAGAVPRRAIWRLRPWLALPESRAAERSRAFDPMRTAAQALESLRRAVQPVDATDIYQVVTTSLTRSISLRVHSGQQTIAMNQCPLRAASRKKRSRSSSC
jgi:hypothetical protein